ncbi:MAG: hypothetical protein WC091_02580 [Sulfuricellaceae bacterium]
MNRQNLLSEITKAEQTQREAAAHIDKLRKMLDEPEGCWKPAKFNEGYCVTGNGSVCGSGHGFDAIEYNYFGNCFPTKEAAELHVKKLNVIQKLRELAGGYKPVWGNGKCIYSIVFDNSQKEWVATARTFTMDNFMLPYFSTMEAAQAAITTLGDELNCLLEG